MDFNFTNVEQAFFNEMQNKNISTRPPYITVNNFPKLGLFTALRFLEWVLENPEGVISLPTGKTPEYFIKWTHYLLENWNTTDVEKIKAQYGLTNKAKPDLRGLRFVQIDEFYPIHAYQHNSFYYFVNSFYIKGFGLDPAKALFINCDEIPLDQGISFTDIFPEHIVDLTLRYRDAQSKQEQMTQKSIFFIDDWCQKYEAKIRDIGGITFFLGGIGPDGHIAFNTRGSDHYSTTRLTATNFETQAVAATDLGGIEISRNRLVITVGLETITYNKDAVAIIFAAGEAKAQIVRDSLQSPTTNVYPATVLRKLKNSRFYLTAGAAKLLTDYVDQSYFTGEWNDEKTDRAVIDLCRNVNTYGPKLKIEQLEADRYTAHVPDLDEDRVQQVINRIEAKINRGLKKEENQVFLHTGPHHDDIMLGILPYINRQLRIPSNDFHFAIMTSGFTAVTNHFLLDALKDTKLFLEQGKIEMIEYPDFFTTGYNFKWNKDVYHYLIKVASGEPHERRRGLCHRIVRALVHIYELANKEALSMKIEHLIAKLETSYDGEKNPPDIQKLKGMLREFEEELVWAHFGVRVDNVHHLRLGFYTGDIFTEQPDKGRDVQPILDLIRKINPTVISLAFDPEGSGPDTHYKVLQAIAEALRLWKEEKDLSALRIIGYRNVWYRFDAAEADVIVPVSLNGLSILDDALTNCYLSQVDASFPSYQHDGKFSELTQKIWVEQLRNIQFLLGKDFFYDNENPKIRSCHGMLYFKEMSVDTFLSHARKLEKSIEGMIKI